MDSHFDEDQWSLVRSQLIFSYSVSTQRILPKTFNGKVIKIMIYCIYLSNVKHIIHLQVQYFNLIHYSCIA